MKRFNCLAVLAVAVLLVGCAGRGRTTNSAAVEQSVEVVDTTTIAVERVINPELISKVDVAMYKDEGIIAIESVDPFVVQSYEPIVIDGKEPEFGGLNSYRFDYWDDEKWADNNYIRTMRLYIDAYRIGALADEQLDSCNTNGDFVLYGIEPFLAGGAYVSVVFVDSPEDIIGMWIYSFVEFKDENEEIPAAISGYDVRAVDVKKNATGFKKRDIEKLLLEQPTIKRW